MTFVYIWNKESGYWQTSTCQSHWIFANFHSYKLALWMGLFSINLQRLCQIIKSLLWSCANMKSVRQQCSRVEHVHTILYHFRPTHPWIAGWPRYVFFLCAHTCLHISNYSHKLGLLHNNIWRKRDKDNVCHVRLVTNTSWGCNYISS